MCVCSCVRFFNTARRRSNTECTSLVLIVNACTHCSTPRNLTCLHMCPGAQQGSAEQLTQQQRVFTNWVNRHLKKKGTQVVCLYCGGRECSLSPLSWCCLVRSLCGLLCFLLVFSRNRTPSAYHWVMTQCLPQAKGFVIVFAACRMTFVRISRMVFASSSSWRPSVVVHWAPTPMNLETSSRFLSSVLSRVVCVTCR